MVLLIECELLIPCFEKNENLSTGYYLNTRKAWKRKLNTSMRNVAKQRVNLNIKIPFITKSTFAVS